MELFSTLKLKSLSLYVEPGGIDTVGILLCPVVQDLTNMDTKKLNSLGIIKM